ncbi:hypothetical protein L2E82_50819 [Cichorium intybus]|nr:hypothetical protein L2E82_50819 [Cichorium intybus]
MTNAKPLPVKLGFKLTFEIGKYLEKVAKFGFQDVGIKLEVLSIMNKNMLELFFDHLGGPKEQRPYEYRREVRNQMQEKLNDLSELVSNTLAIYSFFSDDKDSDEI